MYYIYMFIVYYDNFTEWLTDAKSLPLLFNYLRMEYLNFYVCLSCLGYIIYLVLNWYCGRNELDKRIAQLWQCDNLSVKLYIVHEVAGITQFEATLSWKRSVILIVYERNVKIYHWLRHVCRENLCQMGKILFHSKF